MDPIKEAFNRAKQDISSLQLQLGSIKDELMQIKRTLDSLISQQTNQQTHNPTPNQTQSSSNYSDLTHSPTQNLIRPSNTLSIDHAPTDNIHLYRLKDLYNSSSIGNRGVPTDRQTNQQTHQHIPISESLTEFDLPIKLPKLHEDDKLSHLDRVSSVLESLDNIKKEIRVKFKHLTQQEMTVFSTIYELENKGFIVDYSAIAQKISLSESSIRDYVQKIIKKGIPIIKTKENNKKILLSIAPERKKIASLSTILALRSL